MTFAIDLVSLPRLRLHPEKQLICWSEYHSEGICAQAVNIRACFGHVIQQAAKMENPNHDHYSHNCGKMAHGNLVSLILTVSCVLQSSHEVSQKCPCEWLMSNSQHLKVQINVEHPAFHPFQLIACP
jgi:hypothetical protein